MVLITEKKRSKRKKKKKKKGIDRRDKVESVYQKMEQKES